MSLHIRPAAQNLGGGIKRSPRPKKNYDEISRDITRNENLSYTAIGILVRLLSNEDGVSQTADDLLREKKPQAKQRRGTGRRALLSALAELRLEGYMQTFILRAEGGLHCTTSIIYDQPQPPPEGWMPSETGVLRRDPAAGAEVAEGHERAQVIEKTEVRLPAVGSRDAGKRIPIEKLKEVAREKSSSTRGACVREPAPASAGAAAAEPVTKTKENKALRIVHGMECWTPQDPLTAAALVKQHGVDAVASAVAALRALGISPLPGRVAQALQRLASAARAAKHQSAADARLAHIDADSKRRGDRDMAELMAAQAHQTSQGRDP